MTTVGLVGYGYWGPNVARNLNVNRQYNLKVICDKKADRIEKSLCRICKLYVGI